MNELGWVKWFMLATSILFIGAFKFFWNWADDNVAEEVVEYVLKQETGIDVDLTPESPEDRSSRDKTSQVD